MWTLVSLAVAASSVAAQSLSILQNPSFEAAIWLDLGWNWTCAVAANTCGVNHPDFGPGQVSSDGENSAYVQPTCVLSQATTAVKGATYQLTFDAYAAYELRGFLQPNVQLGWGSTPLAWGAGGTLLSVQNGTDTNGTTSGPYGTFAMNITAAGNDVLSFTYSPNAKPSIADTDENGSLIPALRVDNVALAHIADASSPPLNGSEKGLVAGCVVLGVFALCLGIWGAIATTRLMRANKIQRNEVGVESHPRDIATSAGKDTRSLNASPESTFGATSLSQSPPSQRAPEIMQEQGSWNMYEKDTYEDYPTHRRT